MNHMLAWALPSLPRTTFTLCVFTMQAIRFAVTAELPDQEGHGHREPNDYEVGYPVVALCQRFQREQL